jgi:hypothetical protein
MMDDRRVDGQETACFAPPATGSEMHANNDIYALSHGRHTADQTNSLYQEKSATEQFFPGDAFAAMAFSMPDFDDDLFAEGVQQNVCSPIKGLAAEEK